MLIIGCDFHTRYQQIAMARKETAELLVERLGAPASSCEAGLTGLREAILNGIDGDQPCFSYFIGQITAPRQILQTPY
jgi:hypothetical protein